MTGKPRKKRVIRVAAANPGPDTSKCTHEVKSCKAKARYRAYSNKCKKRASARYECAAGACSAAFLI